jgi:two-component system sensor histidine kinase UhpB
VAEIAVRPIGSSRNYFGAPDWSNPGSFCQREFLFKFGAVYGIALYSRTVGTRYDQLSHDQPVRLADGARSNPGYRANSGEKFALAFKACPDPILITHQVDGTILDANEAFDRIYGIPAARLIGRSTLELGIWRDAATRNCMIEMLKADGRVRNLECVIKVASGQERHGLISAEPIRIEDEDCLVVIFRDITLQKQAEQALRKSQEQYRNFISLSSEGIVRVDFDQPISVSLPVEEQVEAIARSGFLAECNDAAARNRGWSSGRQLLGKRPGDLYRFDDPATRKTFSEFVKGGYRVEDGITVAAGASGEEIYFLNNAVGIVSEGYLRHLWAVQRNISERVRTEQALRESEVRFQNLAAAAFEGIAFCESGRIVDANEQLAQMLGYTREELINRPVADLAAPESQSLVEQMVRTGYEAPYSHIAIRKDGSTFPVEVQARMFFSGNRYLRVTSVRDITARKQAEEALRLSEERFEMAVRGSSDGIWDWDVRNNTVYYSPRFGELLGYQAGEFPDSLELFSSHVHPDDRTLRGNAIRAHFEKREPYDVEFRLQTRSNAYRWFRSRGQAIWDKAGDAVRMAGSLTDIHDHKVAEESLRRAQREALTAQEEFTQRLISAQEQERKRLANELHDSLGQNLSLIKNRAYLALQIGLSEAASLHLNAISEIITEAINEVRNLAQNLRPLNIDQFGVTDALQNLIAQAGDSANLTIERRLENVDDLFQGEEATNIYRVVQEALNNLVKHAAADRALVAVERDLHCVRIRIEDSGRGFNPDQVMALRKSRTGIGLTSISERVRMLRGAVQIRSAPGSGTQIRIEIPQPGMEQTRPTEVQRGPGA